MPELQPENDTWIAAWVSSRRWPSPGERWMYSTGASVAGVLCARTANQPFPHVLSTRVFEPLGMRDTGFFTTAIERPATSYQPAPDGLIVRDPPDGAWGRPERVF